ncbi:MAG: sulfatase-like hydrolase/transferase, partial [Myxococcota bacterium]
DPVDPPTAGRLLTFDGPPPTNLVMISIDTLRRDRIGRYAPGGASLTPYLDGIAAAGVALDRHQQVANWTLPATSTTLLGRFGWELGFLPDLDADTVVPESDDFLAVQLGQAGFWSVLRTGNKFLSSDLHNAQGYSDADLVGGPATAVAGVGAAALGEALEGPTPPGRWFLHVHLMEPHAAYDPPDSYLAAEAGLDPVPYDLTDRGSTEDAAAAYPTMAPADQALLRDHLVARYDGEVRYLDDQLAQIWADYEGAGLLDDALVVVWSDHGEQLGDRGYLLHGNHLAAEENDGIVLFWARNLVPAAWDHPTTTLDLVPTVLDALGLPADPDHDGLVVGTAPDDRPLYGATISRLDTGLSCVTVDGWKLSLTWATGALTLVDRTTDPTEQVDRYDPADPRAVSLWPLLRQVTLDASAANQDYPVVWPSPEPAAAR